MRDTQLTPVYAAIQDQQDRMKVGELVPSRFSIVDGNPARLLEELSILSFARFYDQKSFDQIADKISASHEPIFVLGLPHPESHRHHNIYFSNEDPIEVVTKAFRKAIKRADEGMIPHTKEFAIVSIDNPLERACIVKLLEELNVGAFINNQGDYRFLESIWGNCYARFLDATTFALIQDDLKSHLDLDTAPFVLVGGNVSAPFEHPQLVCLKDKSADWLAQILDEGKEWDTIECERFREVM